MRPRAALCPRVRPRPERQVWGHGSWPCGPGHAGGPHVMWIPAARHGREGARRLEPPAGRLLGPYRRPRSDVHAPRPAGLPPATGEINIGIDHAARVPGTVGSALDGLAA